MLNVDEPEKSYLALARSDGDDGRLHAWEIAKLRLSYMQIVVLSACSTLNPRATRAGAAAGLAYSFLSAGVPATVSTLWDINDAIMADLLTVFHEELLKGINASAALRQAQLRALHSSNPALRASKTWASLAFTGS